MEIPTALAFINPSVIHVTQKAKRLHHETASTSIRKVGRWCLAL